MGQEFFSEFRLDLCFKHASAKARDGVRERNFGFPQRGHFVMKVILGNAHVSLERRECCSGGSGFVPKP